MTDIDDSTIREQARNIILDHAKDIEYLSIGEMIGDLDQFSGLPEEEFDRAQGRIDKMIRNAVVTVSWPGEQQLADTVSGEQQDGAAGDKGSVRAASLLAFLDLHRERRGHDVIASLAVGDGRTVELTQVQLRAVLAERDALAARVAELEGEREADARAVAELVKLGDVSFQGAWLTDWEDAKGALAARFADRITAQAAERPEEA